MTTVQFDSQKIEQLLKAATSERQRKMYQALLDKARKQERSSTKNKRSQTIPSTEKTTQTTTKSSTKTQKKTKTVKKNQKVATQFTTTEVSTTTKQSSKTLTESSPLPPAPVTSETITSETTTTEQAPQTEPQSQSKKKKKKKKQQPTVKAPIFQAIGTMIATPYFQDEQSYIKINDSEYDLLYVQGKRRQAYMRLKEELEKNGSSPIFLRLYPKATFDYKTQQPRIAFSLVGFSRDCEKINEQPPGFMLRGIWQYIPHSKTPVITIYRNHDQKLHFKNLSKSRQLAFAQLRHVPVVWDAPVEPFKYNPEAEKDAQMPRYFVEVRAIFKDGLFTVEEMLSEPTRKIPKLIKISKSS